MFAISNAGRTLCGTKLLSLCSLPFPLRHDRAFADVVRILHAARSADIAWRGRSRTTATARCIGGFFVGAVTDEMLALAWVSRFHHEMADRLTDWQILQT